MFSHSAVLSSVAPKIQSNKWWTRGRFISSSVRIIGFCLMRTIENCNSNCGGWRGPKWRQALVDPLSSYCPTGSRSQRLDFLHWTAPLNVFFECSSGWTRCRFEANCRLHMFNCTKFGRTGRRHVFETNAVELIWMFSNIISVIFSFFSTERDENRIRTNPAFQQLQSERAIAVLWTRRFSQGELLA